MRSLPVLAALVLLAPAVAAADYTYAAAPVSGGCSLLPHHPLPFPDPDDPICVGAIVAPLPADRNLLVVAEDLVYGPNVPLAACTTSAPSGACDDGFWQGCGPVLAPAGIGATHLIVYVQALLVTEDLGVCAATAGTLSVHGAS